MARGNEIERLLVQAEEAIQKLQKKYPQLTFFGVTTAAGVVRHYVIEGADHLLEEARSWLSTNDHDHTVERKRT